ncbi:MAG: hypothetical protein H7Y32_12350, partial [Chloroflexales bacterium]|nr:hypothetical protein [Chloroflexales bacterium]
MSETLTTAVEQRHDFPALLAAIAQAPDVAELVNRCGGALEVLLPGGSFALTWIAGGERQLGAGGAIVPPAPNEQQRAQLEAGALVGGAGKAAWLP